MTDGSGGAAFIDLDRFPPVPVEARPRRVVLSRMSFLDREALVARGYAPTTLMELPRNTPGDEIAYLMARCQGIEEGTLPGGKVEIEAIKLQMQAHGMLKSTGVQMKVKLDVGSEDVEALLKAWGGSRYTLRGNSTMVSAQLTPKARQLEAGVGKRIKEVRDRGARKRASKPK